MGHKDSVVFTKCHFRDGLRQDELPGDAVLTFILVLRMISKILTQGEDSSIRGEAKAKSSVSSSVTDV